MKLKLSFVTNSSSSSFIFIFNGNERGTLFDLIRKYKEKFNLTEDFSYGDFSDVRSVNYHFVIDCLDELFDKGNKIKTIDILIDEVESHLEYWKKEVKKYKKEKEKNPEKYNFLEYSERYQKEAEDRIEQLKRIKSNGLLNFMKIEFGDSHGDFHGDTPSVLDYNAKFISMEKDDLAIITENNH